ncbi:MAG: hypothetical protein HYX92_02685 [Chloroflexi bacterium]|nr:hypothetical protein [Chloroflexota bacterium]
MEALAPLGVVLALAFLCESLTEYFFSDLLAAAGMDKRYLRYIAAAVGMALALTYGLDAIDRFLGISPRVPHLGEALTGLVLGRGANYVHDFYGNYVGGRRPER